jgi:hypothetical protein
MLMKAAAGLAGLGLIGGTGTVIYQNNGDTTVEIKNERSGRVQTVEISTAGGQTFSCPVGTRDKLEPHDIKLGRIKLTLQNVRRAERKIERRYPSHEAPGNVVNRYDALGRRDDQLVQAFNTGVDRRNAILDRDCTAAD